MVSRLRKPAARAATLEDLPNVGKAIAADLRALGIRRPCATQAQGPLRPVRPSQSCNRRAPRSVCARHVHRGGPLRRRRPAEAVVGLHRRAQAYAGARTGEDRPNRRAMPRAHPGRGGPCRDDCPDCTSITLRSSSMVQAIPADYAGVTPVSHHSRCRARARVLQEGVWCRGAAALSRPRRQDRSRRNQDRRGRGHARRRVARPGTKARRRSAAHQSR